MINMINNDKYDKQIPIRIAEGNRSTCLNYLVLKSPGLESSAFKIQRIKTKDRLREVKVHSEIKLMRG